MRTIRLVRLLAVIASAILTIAPLAAQVPPAKFGPAGFIGLGRSTPDSIAVGDLNGDGKLDIVLADYYSNEVTVLLGNGDGTFQPPVIYTAGGYGFGSVAIGDLNGDGIPDLVVTNECQTYRCSGGNDGITSVLLGNGDGTFQPPVTYSSGGYDAGYTSVGIGDVNRDGKPDLVVINFCQSVDNCSNGTVAVLLGNGDGTFQAPLIYNSGGGGATSVAIADVNRDGKPDLIVANQCPTIGNCNDGVVGVLLGRGDGTFRSAVSYGSGGNGPTSVAVADLNGDGKPDVVVANQCLSIDHCRVGLGPGGVGVLLGNGDGTFQPALSYKTGGLWAGSVAIGDVNGDGIPDLAIANLCQFTDIYADCLGTSKVGVLRGNGDGTFQSVVGFSSGGLYSASAAIGDVNRDGRPDVVVADQCNPTCTESGVGVLLNVTSDSTKTALTSSPNPSLVNQTVTFTATITSNPPVPNGEVVTFYNGTTKLGKAATTNGVATLNASFSKAMTYTIKAKYPGDAFRKASAGTVIQVVNP